MPGMNGRLSANNPTIVAAFHSALFHQGLVALGILLFVLVGWAVVHAAALRTALSGTTGPGSPGGTGSAAGSEPLARRLLRIGFALFWILDGLLQAQASMPLGLVTQSIQPASASSPSWVRHLVDVGGTIWNDHPITAATATVWIQLGIGLFLLLAPRGRWSRLAGGVSVVWGLVVWAFGESFGGIFAPGASWLFGAPGAVVFYCAAGLLVALPERSFAGRRLGRLVLRASGAYFLAMAVLQAWPGRGFWANGAHGSLASMVRGMAGTPQPRSIASFVASFGTFDSRHAFAVNLVVVIALAAIGVALLAARPGVTGVALAAAAVLCLAVWVLVQDFGVFGGVGTDPNSMLPMLTLLAGGYLGLVRPASEAAVARVAVPADAAAPAAPGDAVAGGRLTGWQARAGEAPSYFFRTLAGLGAVALIALGAVPIAVASTNPHADPIVSQAIDGSPNAVGFPAPAFDLVDQQGRSVSLATLGGKVVALTFLDPVCTVDCPIIAQEMRLADRSLGRSARHVVFVAVVANPIYRSLTATETFDRVEGMASLPNWLFLTGSTHALRHTWNAFGEQVAVVPDGSMVAHSDLVYVIDGHGETRWVLDSDPGPGSAASKSSFTTVLLDSIENVLARN